MKKFNKIALILLIPLLLYSCSKNDYKVNIRNIKLENYSINRYEVDLMNIPEDDFYNGIMEIANKYEVFLGNISEDTTDIHIIYNFITDADSKEIYNECVSALGDFSKQEKDFDNSFKYIKYYYPDFAPPDIYTYISGFDYTLPSYYDGEDLFIASDMYLGDNLNYYALGIPTYIVKRLNKDFIVRDCMEQLAIYNNSSDNAYTRLIDLMIYHGKNLEFIKRSSPYLHDTIVTGFTADQLKWCEKNEEDVWKYLITDNTLFTNDLRVIRKLIDEAPYTSFFSQDSPGSVCRWIGWRIIHSYMRNNKVSLEEMMKLTNNDLILNKSGYRPGSNFTR